MPILSKHNELVKKIRKLADRKWRYEYGEYLVEGKRWVTDAKRLCPQNVISVICADDVSCDFADVVLERSLFDSLASTENSQGIMAILRMPAPPEAIEGQYCLLLDRVRDPGNMGTIIRTACAAGYTDIVLHDCVDVYNPKVVRSCMTGMLSVRFHNDIAPATLKASGYTLVAATLGGKDVFSAHLQAEKLCLIIGNEADGISDAIIKECDENVTIPMESNMESLNAAVSAGILMYTLKYANGLRK